MVWEERWKGNGGEVNIYIIIILLFIRPATWRKCNATVTDDGDDDEVDNGVDGDDEGVEYYIFDGREKERLGGPNSNKPTNYGEK